MTNYYKNQIKFYQQEVERIKDERQKNNLDCDTKIISHKRKILTFKKYLKQSKNKTNK